MKLKTPAVLATAGVASASLLLGVGIAGATAAKPADKPAYEGTFTMYANVDAEGHLGSNYDADGVGTIDGTGGSREYIVPFKYSIGACAAAVQVGKAGGTDPQTPAFVNVEPAGPAAGLPEPMPNAFVVYFDRTDTPSGPPVPEPFMMTVTCTSTRPIG